MKFSNEGLLTDITGLRNLSQKQLPVKVSYAIAKNIGKIESELKIYYKEREKLIDKYAQKDDKGNISADDNGQIAFKEESIEDWNKGIKELLSIENDIDIHKFKLEQLEGYSLTPAELMFIVDMIEE